jgi:hypothetical protein
MVLVILLIRLEPKHQGFASVNYYLLSAQGALVPPPGGGGAGVLPAHGALVG